MIKNAVTDDKALKIKRIRYEIKTNVYWLRLQRCKKDSLLKLNLKSNIALLENNESFKKRESLNLIKVLKSLKHTKDIEIKVDPFVKENSGFILRNLCSNFQKMRSLHRLFLDCTRYSNNTLLPFQNFFDSSEIPRTDLKQFCKGLKRLSSLKSLELIFDSCYEINDQALSQIGKGISHLNELKTVKLSFSSCFRISNKGFGQLDKFFGKLKNLKQISAIFDRCRDITDIEIKHLKTIEDLRLSFFECAINNENLKSFSDQLKEIASLKSIHLDFSACEDISDEGMRSLISALRHYKSLRDLRLNFANCKEITDASLKYFKELVFRENISLDFSYCEDLSDEGFCSLGQFLEGLIDLRDLNLCFAYTQITNEGLGYLSNVLNKPLNSLLNLTLKFRSCKEIDDEGLVYLSKCMKRATLLKSVNLCFSSCNRIEDIGLEELGDAFGHLPNLTAIHLTFLACREITNVGLRNFSDKLKTITQLESICIESEDIEDVDLSSLSQSLKCLKSLKEVSFIFMGDSGINDNDLCYLSEGMLDFESLQILILNFWGSDQITDKGLKILCENLRKHSQLSTIALSFYRCDEITDTGINYVKDCLRDFVYLNDVILVFYECTQVSETCANELHQTLQKLPLIQELQINIQG